MAKYDVLFSSLFDPPEPMAGILAAADASLRHETARTEDELIKYGSGADAIIIHGRGNVTATVIDALGSCRMISKTGVGVDGIDVAAATQKGIIIANCPGVSVPEVSDQTMGLMLALSRGIVRVWDLIRQGHWDETGKERLSQLRGPVYRLAGKTLGIVGVGRIGKAVAGKARAFGMRLIAADPYIDPASVADLGVELTDLDRVLRESDFVTFHTPLTGETRGLIDAAAIGKMKATAYLINAARGPIVDFDALYDALATKQIAGAALDVTNPEPLPTDSRFYALENVIITAHTAARSDEAVIGVCTQAAKDVAALLSGGRPEAVINPEVLGK